MDASATPTTAGANTAIQSLLLKLLVPVQNMQSIQEYANIAEYAKLSPGFNAVSCVSRFHFGYKALFCTGY